MKKTYQIEVDCAGLLLYQPCYNGHHSYKNNANNNVNQK